MFRIGVFNSGRCCRGLIGFICGRWSTKSDGWGKKVAIWAFSRRPSKEYHRLHHSPLKRTVTFQRNYDWVEMSRTDFPTWHDELVEVGPDTNESSSSFRVAQEDWIDEILNDRSWHWQFLHKNWNENPGNTRSIKIEFCVQLSLARVHTYPFSDFVAILITVQF